MPITAPIRQVTNFGVPEGDDLVAAAGITAPMYADGQSNQAAIGTMEPLTFTADVGAVTGSVVARILVRGKRRIQTITSGNLAVTGTSSFDLYNETQALALCAAQTVTTGGTSTTDVITNPVVNDGDVLVLRGTSGTSITGLRVIAEGLLLDTPGGL